jgi:hypothetical protein
LLCVAVEVEGDIPDLLFLWRAYQMEELVTVVPGDGVETASYFGKRSLCEAIGVSLLSLGPAMPLSLLEEHEAEPKTSD